MKTARRFLVSFGLQALLSGLCCQALAGPGNDLGPVPGAEFRLPDWLEILAVLLIFAAVVALGKMCLPLTKLPGPPGWAAQAVMVILLLPMFEEILCRFFLLEVVLEGMAQFTHTQAFIWSAGLFALAHLVLAVATTTVSPLAPKPPGIQLCEGCLIGVFNGMLYIALRFMGPGVGLLVTLLYCCLFHTLVNLALVVFNVIVNTMLAAFCVVLHVVLRLGFLGFALFYLIMGHLRGIEQIIREVWMTH